VRVLLLLSLFLSSCRLDTMQQTLNFNLLSRGANCNIPHSLTRTFKTTQLFPSNRTLERE